MDTNKRKRLVTIGGAGLGIAASSLAIGVLNPFTAASAQTTTTAGTAAASAPAPGQGQPGKSISDVLSGLVSDGTLTQDQADKVKAALDAARPSRGPGGDHAQRGPGGRLGASLDDVASFLGTDAATLRSQLEAGSSLADIAGAKKDALITYLVDAANKRIDDAVTAGKMTAEQATELKSHTQDRITNMVNNVRPERGANAPAPTATVN